MKILNFGSLNLDYVYQVDHFVKPGETLNATRQSVHPGGKGLNQSIALARAGAEVYHAGCLGKGGEMLEQLLLENGVHTDFLQKTDTLQGNAVIQVNRDGQNCILLFGGSNRCVTPVQVESTLSHFECGDFLVLQNEINELPHIIDAARDRGMKILLNPSPYDAGLNSVDFGKLDWLIVNEVELEQFSHCADPEAAWKKTRAEYPGLCLLVTLGSAGSIAFTPEETVHQPAFPVKAIDTTGAGDTYTGYFVALLARQQSLESCMRQASMASAISVTRPGAASSVPDAEEVMQHLLQFQN